MPDNTIYGKLRTPMDHYHGELDASPEQLGEYVCPNGHPFPSPVLVSCTCGARVSCVPLGEGLALRRQIDGNAALGERIRAVRSRIALINTDTDRPSARKDWTDLVWACEELQAVADALDNAR